MAHVPDLTNSLRTRPADRPRPLPARNQQREPDQAQAFLCDHDELARATPDHHEVVVETIAATTNKIGLSVQPGLDTNAYPKGIKISDKQMAIVESAHLRRHDFHGRWSYTLNADCETAGNDNTTAPDHRA